MWSKKTFLGLRARFVERRDALMQILVSLDRDKNSSVGVARSLVASEKTLFCCEDYQLSLRVRRDLRSDFVLLKRLLIELVSEKRLTVGLCFCFSFFVLFCFVFLSRRLPIGLASEERITVGLLSFFIWWRIGLASERDKQSLLVRPRSPLVARRKRALKKNFFASNLIKGKKTWIVPLVITLNRQNE